MTDERIIKKIHQEKERKGHSREGRAKGPPARVNTT